MTPRPLGQKDKALFDSYLHLAKHYLGAYAFENIYIWRALFDIRWIIIEEALCVIFQDKLGQFLYLPPLTKKLNPEVIAKIFHLLETSPARRIDNIEEEDLGIFSAAGCRIEERATDYIAKRVSLAALRGNGFKSKRSDCNYFSRHYPYEYRPYEPSLHKECLALYDAWAGERRHHEREEAHYRWMLEDSRVALEEVFNNFSQLGYTGRVIFIEGKIKAFTIGYALNASVFCVLYEVADLSCQGIAQFIFREFCRELESFEYINMMDDSGLQNLRRVKLSYKPLREARAYSAIKI